MQERSAGRRGLDGNKVSPEASAIRSVGAHRRRVPTGLLEVRGVPRQHALESSDDVETRASWSIEQKKKPTGSQMREVLRRRNMPKRKDFFIHGFSEGCPSRHRCWRWRTLSVVRDLPKTNGGHYDQVGEGHSRSTTRSSTRRGPHDIPKQDYRVVKGRTLRNCDLHQKIKDLLLKTRKLTFVGRNLFLKRRKPTLNLF